MDVPTNDEIADNPGGRAPEGSRGCSRIGGEGAARGLDAMATEALAIMRRASARKGVGGAA